MSEIVVTTTPVILPADDVPVNQQWEESERIGGIFPYMDFMHLEKFAASEEVKEILKEIEVSDVAIILSTVAYTLFVGYFLISEII